MRRPQNALSALLALPALVAAVNLDCKDIVVDKVAYDLSPLGGPHSVHWIRDMPPSVMNFTFTLDICKGLKDNTKIPTGDKCPVGTRVCGIDSSYNPAENHEQIVQVVPIAGDFQGSTGKTLDPKITRLRHSDSNADADKEGLRIELNGGKYPMNKRKGQKQKALIEFLCDNRTDGVDESQEDKEKEKRREERRLARLLKREEQKKDEDGEKDDDKDDDKDKDDDDDDDDDKDSEDKRPLKFISYKEEADQTKVLRLEWRTKYACEKRDGADSPSKTRSEHWGFFTWFIIIVFLAIATYLIFGSWLNYNRYGARGWDLLPHGDTIRDIPYILKDFGRRVVGALQGGGDRGGYSAV
ncbi:uncharacterized protein K452DRAFT_325997 [Aplosporella prunicola CBS 121167]|uniref:Autophagy-related protein 27 n=1 Tax=Aplosporella prunicola CBS 121167 TaxID=1176127 RepID=A0A6A6BH67_9PEZI|nr:uncharacterized protein K452DRAFT_325997 [Aplosporella prunicola CBS 121167]KAF2143492.1 hypothetical protein K452DRAFT_325997 [Aplosporella prunicola CBS 121167]